MMLPGPGRDSFDNCIRYKIGNGDYIFNWYDQWHDDGPLVKKFGLRIVYDTVSHPNSKLSDYMQGADGNFPELLQGI